jgi:hypothetical protein
MGDHAMWVAGVIISKQTSVPAPLAPPRSPPIGVAQEAVLFSSAFADITQPSTDFQAKAAVAAQHLATIPAMLPTYTEIRAINMSFGLAFDSSSTTLDGSSTLTQFVDWSARVHDIVYVIAGSEHLYPTPPGGFVPIDNLME